MKCVCAGYWAQDLCPSLVNLHNSPEKPTQLGNPSHGRTEAQRSNLCTESLLLQKSTYIQQRTKSWLQTKCNHCLHQGRKTTSGSIHDDTVSNTTPNLYKLLLQLTTIHFSTTLWSLQNFQSRNPQLDICKTQYIKSYCPCHSDVTNNQNPGTAVALGQACLRCAYRTTYSAGSNPNSAPYCVALSLRLNIQELLLP